jgi:hypothetical protein
MTLGYSGQSTDYGVVDPTGVYDVDDSAELMLQ